eukprot:scaffold17808_cov66-Skeletonema_menzelii.AAC.1
MGAARGELGSRRVCRASFNSNSTSLSLLSGGRSLPPPPRANRSIIFGLGREAGKISSGGEIGVNNKNQKNI